FIAPASGPATLSAQLASITPAVAAPFLDAATTAQIAGRIDASIRLESDRPALDRVRGSIVLDRADLSLAGVALNQRTTTTLSVGSGRVAVDAWDWGSGENRVTVRGGATLADDPALDIVAASVLDLRLLNIVAPQARVVGRADAELRVGGT